MTDKPKTGRPVDELDELEALMRNLMDDFFDRLDKSLDDSNICNECPLKLAATNQEV